MNFETVFLQSLGWALVHVVWQITALALLLALLLPRLKSAHQRYWAAFYDPFFRFWRLFRYVRLGFLG